ncbi:MAG: hypothetical protein KC777_20515 [Cyanobacteria bacterium HKST-UBA02]|nr:hypothetical protein [Cyanobacteria bacterium HKST-UBA02]
MLKFHLAKLTVAITLASLASMTAFTPGNAGADEIDLKKYVGTYIPAGSHVAGLGKVEKVEIRKDGDALRIVGLDAWAKSRFVPDKGKKLVDRVGALGSLIPGEIRFADGQSTRKVLRADFCYDFFIFLGSSIDGS